MIKRILIPASVLLLQGCMTLQPANYRPHHDSYIQLQSKSHCTVAVTEQRAVNESIEKLSIRGAGFVSPTGDGFSGFIAGSLNEEFGKAGVYATPPQRALKVLMEKNSIDAAIGTASADIAATFTVVDTQNQAQVAKIPISVHRSWESSFVGVTAVNLAISQYSEAVAELNGKLISDPQFQRAIDCPDSIADR